MPSFDSGRAVATAWLIALALAAQAGAQAARASETPIRTVHREVFPELVRVTFELDREVPLYQERSGNPARLYLDLKDTRPVPALAGATFHFDADLVREIRFTSRSPGTTRIVLDLDGVSRYSVYTLYAPYRVIVDFERSARLDKLQAAVADSIPGPAPAAPAVNAGGKFSVARQLGLGVSRIVIDAGHGGHDPGARSFGVSEAELVLDVAIRLEKLLQQRPGFETVLTRRTDEYVTLEDRTGIANKESADLFLSIHANASANAAARGVETYFLNFALNPQAEAVAARENAPSDRTMSSLPGILKAITLNSKLNESRDFAGLVQAAMVRGLRPANPALRDLGVKQAPFMVLIGAAMPSALAEISFVTNRDEARLLKTPAYRQKIAESLLAGVLKYQQALKKVQSASLR